MSSYPEDYSGVSERELSINDDDESTNATEFDGSNSNNYQEKIRDPHSQRAYNEYDEYQDLETLDEHDQEDDE